ncbi:MAG: hypothetical protein PHT19_10410 [Methylococcus sp.]|nr:hypothetical protein [Methylococcus sp.]
MAHPLSFIAWRLLKQGPVSALDLARTLSGRRDPAPWWRECAFDVLDALEHAGLCRYRRSEARYHMADKPAATTRARSRP